METPPRKAYPSDVTDDEWAFVAPSLTLMAEDAPQRTHDLREVVNGLRFIVRTGMPWRFMPNDLPPWPAVYQQTRRWRAAGVFEAIVHDLRELLRVAQGRAPAGTGRRTVARDARGIATAGLCFAHGPESGAPLG
jgi:transposase